MFSVTHAKELLLSDRKRFYLALRIYDLYSRMSDPERIPPSLEEAKAKLADWLCDACDDSGHPSYWRVAMEIHAKLRKESSNG